MPSLFELVEKPSAEEMYMIAGWRQWADAGAVSSGLPEYLVSHTGARSIGQVRPEGFYLFQIPGAHDMLRPVVKMQDGYRQKLTGPQNNIYYAGLKKGLVIFLGDEPHLDAQRYANTLFDVAQELNVRRICALGGVYGPVPYDKERNISCSYSLTKMKDELAQYAVRFSDYEGGVSLGTYLASEAETRQIELFSLYAFVPAYDLTELASTLQGMAIENDYKAWYDIMRRLNRMFGLQIDLADLRTRSDEVQALMDAKINEIEQMLPQANVREHLNQAMSDFVEMPFAPLGDVWERELGDILGDWDQ